MNQTLLEPKSLRLLQFSLFEGPNKDGLFNFDEPKPHHILVTEVDVAGQKSKNTQILGVSQSCWLEVMVGTTSLEQEKSLWEEVHGQWLGLLQVNSIETSQIKVYWRRNRAIILASVIQQNEAIAAFIEFAYYEHFLHSIENEVVNAWSFLEEDTPLAYNVSNETLKQDKALGQRVVKVFQLRIRFIGIENHLLKAPVHTSKVAAKLGNSLREESDCEDRSEIIDTKLETLEYIYELISGRLGEFRNTRHGSILEIIIIFLLTAEVVIMLIELFKV